MNFVILFLCSVLSIGASAAHEAHFTEPGSRSIYVKNYEIVDGNYIRFLELYLRTCTCKRKSHRRRNTAFYLCSCWDDFRPEDQPAIQGTPKKLLVLFDLVRCPNIFLFCEQDKKTGEVYLNLLAPEALKIVLREIKLEHLIEFVSGTEPLDIDGYLELLAQQKIPVGTPNYDHDGDSNLQYHFYFHDLFNHLPFWIFSSDVFRDKVSDNAYALRTFFSALSLIWQEDSMARDLITLFKFYAIANFDEAMGTANNYILTKKLSVMDMSKLNFSKPRDRNSPRSDILEQIKNALERTVNFGVLADVIPDDVGHYVYTERDRWEFVRSWVDAVASSVVECFAVKDHDSFHLIDTIKKDPFVYDALLRLRAFDGEQIRDKLNQMKESAARKLPEYAGAKSSGAKRFISTEAFALEMNFNVQKASQKWAPHHGSQL